ncbi:HIT domain-containing protein [Candidatus Pacearchaeota archaeon]|nr:hypothetical protein [uncultured archaeon]MBS3084376.1 HIT domain-containing protein [Candidatus Pacearchaeota archaeon]
MEKTKKDLENIKSRLIEHIKKNYDEEKALTLISNINEMGEEEFVEFLKEQGLLGENEKNSQCIFCSIVFGDIPSSKIGENEKAIAILDINPASTGHSLIIPKEHINSKESLPKETEKLALEIKEKLKKVFNPKRVDFVSSNIMGHDILNVLPVYKSETLNSERKRASPEELENIKEKLDEISSEKNSKQEEKLDEKEKGEEEISDKSIWLPKRFP